MRLSNLEEEIRVVEGIQVVFGALYEELGFDKILPQKSQNHVLLSTVLARVADPQKGYLKFTQCEGNVSAVINEKKIEADAQWDGMAGIITNSDKPALELLARYRHYG